MNVAVVVFPGTNCEQDVAYALGAMGARCSLVWHRETDLSGFDAVVLPGGFAHGDYLRAGAIAGFSPVMAEVARLAASGCPVLGICNGFQILCEAGLLPGALIENRDLRFLCMPVHVRVSSTASVVTAGIPEGTVLRLPLNSYEGNFVARASVEVILQYCGPDGEVSPEHNPNGSMWNAAAAANPAGNVVGVMPHPERAVEAVLGSEDGRLLFESFLRSPARV